MAYIEEVMQLYNGYCAEVGVLPNPYIKKIMTMICEVTLTSKTRNTELIQLRLMGNNHLMTTQRLDDEDIRHLCSVLPSCQCINALDLRYNNLTDAVSQAIGQMLSANDYLQKLVLTGNNFGAEGAKHIANGLRGNDMLQLLQLTGNKIGDEGGMAIAKMLQINKALQYLDLSDCDINTDTIIAICTIAKTSSSLKGLNFNRPLLRSESEEAAVHIGDMLAQNHSLEELHMEKFQMSDFGFTRIASGLERNENLRILNVRCNRITRDGCAQIFKTLSSDRVASLQQLDLGYNRIGSPGAHIIAAYLSSDKCHLSGLSIAFNEIKADGIIALCNSLTIGAHPDFQCRLEQLYLWGNRAGLENSEACEALNDLINIKRRIEPHNTDVRPYYADARFQVAELTSRPRRWYYDAPFYGDDVPVDHQGFAEYVATQVKTQTRTNTATEC